MKCPRCNQNNPPERERCWNCNEPLEQPHIGDLPLGARDASPPGSASAPPGDEQRAADGDVSDLGVLGPLRLERRAGVAVGPVLTPGSSQPNAADRRMSRFLVSSIIGGAISGGVALAILFGLLAVAGFQPGRASAGALISIVRGFIMGVVNGGIVGALVAYYGGGIGGGATMGAALAAGMWLVQAIFAGAIIPGAIPGIMLTAVVLALAGAIMGALVGAVVESVSPHRV
jgi:hypothetical protein